MTLRKVVQTVKHMAGKHPQKRHGHRGGSGGGSLQGKGRTSTDPELAAAMNKADTQAVGELKQAIPSAQLVEVWGDYVHEPRVSAVLPRSAKPQQVIKDLRAKGWKSKKGWNKPESISMYKPGTSGTLAIHKQESSDNNLKPNSNRGSGYTVNYLPRYAMEDFPVD